jgi:hypothetical protein
MELGWFRRNWLVPVPESANLDSFNDWLLTSCGDAKQHLISGRRIAIGDAMAEERPHLLPLLAEGFEITETLYPVIVDGYGRVKVKGNWYSTPLYPGSRVTVRVWPAHIEVSFNGRVSARHERSYGHGQHLLNLEHYLDVLEKKPGAMRNATPLQQWREAGRWPACMDTIWQRLEARHGRAKGTREMIALVRAGTGADAWPKLIEAVEEALRLGLSDTAAVLHILRMPDVGQRERYAVALADELRQFERPMPVMDEYDSLLSLASPIEIIQ